MFQLTDSFGLFVSSFLLEFLDETVVGLAVNLLAPAMIKMSILPKLTAILFLLKNSFHPFKKDNNVLLYINSESNHPPCIKKQLPSMIEKRLSDLSSSKDVFEKKQT